MRRRGDRGLTFVTVLILVGAAAAVFWFVTYGPAYWENFEVKRVLKEAANLSYREHDHGRILTEMRIDVDDGDLRIERTQIPAFIHIWLTYSRDVQVPLLNQQRRVTFNEYAEQDLSPVKW